MKRILVCTLLACMAVLAASAADVNGKWTGTFTPEGGGGGAAYMVLKQTGTTVTGTAGPDENQQWPDLKGTIKGDKVTAEVKNPEDGTVYKCELTLSGDKLKGEVIASQNGQTQKAQLDLTRVK
jgi:uncharacterized protein (DUF2147 family)